MRNLMKQFVELGYTSETFEKMLQNGQQLANEVLDYVNSKDEQIYQFQIDYSRSVSEMIKDGKYDLINKGITPRRYPVPNEYYGKKFDVSAKVFTFNHPIKLHHLTVSHEIIKETMSRYGFRVATSHELLAFGAKYPERQRQGTIISLELGWEYCDCYRCLILTSHRLDRVLAVTSVSKKGGSSWDGINGFLGIKTGD